jgi:hypothetical protein
MAALTSPVAGEEETKTTEHAVFIGELNTPIVVEDAQRLGILAPPGNAPFVTQLAH